ncbi:hypothetical protein BDN72DRAFT_841169, partial [Pluteus cervinus]
MPDMPDPCAKELVEAWPGIFKWSAYFYNQISASIVAQNSATTSSQGYSRVGIIRDVIIGSWCSLALSQSAKRAMLETRGFVDIMARLWIFEDTLGATEVTPYCEGIPMGSYLLDLLSDDGDQTTLNKVISATGEDIGTLAETTLSQLKKAIKSPRFTSNPVDCSFIFQFSMRVFRSKPEVRDTFLTHGAISVGIDLLIQTASIMNGRTRSFEERAQFVVPVRRIFQFLWHSLRSRIELTSVLEAISAGLFTAFVECSPIYDDLKHEDYLMVSATITNMVPRYLAYLCVVQATDAMLLRLERTKQFLSLQKTKAWEAMDRLATLTGWRFAVIRQFKHTKKTSMCSNPKCWKIDTRSTFRKCAKCHSSFYCSKECQGVHWKEFGHKEECHDANKAQSVFQEDGSMSFHDWEYIQHLNLCEARCHMPYLKRLVATEHTGVPLDDLVVVINYDTIPATYGVDLRSEWVSKGHATVFSYPMNKYRPDRDPKSPTFIAGVIPDGKGGRGQRVCVTPFDGIWTYDEQPTTSDDGNLAAGALSTGKSFIEWMNKEVEARRKLYHRLVSSP